MFRTISDSATLHCTCNNFCSKYAASKTWCQINIYSWGWSHALDKQCLLWRPTKVGWRSLLKTTNTQKTSAHNYVCSQQPSLAILLADKMLQVAALKIAVIFVKKCEMEKIIFCMAKLQRWPALAYYHLSQQTQRQGRLWHPSIDYHK